MSETNRSTDGALAVLARPELAPLWEAARRRLERNGVALSGAPLVLSGLSPEARDAVAGLLGRPRAAGPVRIRLEDLDRVLRSSAAGTGLVDLLEHMGGPLRDRRAERAASSQARTELWERAGTHAAVTADERLAAWLDAARSQGVVARLAAAGDPSSLLGAALDILRVLPADGIPLARLAAETAGDAHALDRRRPLGSLVTHALAFLGGRPAPATAADWRGLWADSGVACDDLSCDVLVLNFRVSDEGETAHDTLLASTLSEHAEVGEPLRVTLRMLLRTSLGAPPGTRVFVCENPAVVAHAAESLGSSCAPLVCVDGVPNTAARVLLQRCIAARAEVDYHGDFDWGGVRIGNQVIGGLGARPWRFGAADYRDAISDLGRGTSGVTLAGPSVIASWDGDLAVAMAAHGVAVFEEQLLDLLSTDLATGRGADRAFGWR